MLDCIVDGENGLLATPNDAEDLAIKLRALLDDPARGARLGASARQTVVDQFSEPVIMGRFATLFRSVAGRRRSHF
jgi:glycosyltransferase involved in cell wall biosynthesis